MTAAGNIENWYELAIFHKYHYRSRLVQCRGEKIANPIVFIVLDVRIILAQRQAESNWEGLTPNRDHEYPTFYITHIA